MRYRFELKVTDADGRVVAHRFGGFASGGQIAANAENMEYTLSKISKNAVNDVVLNDDFKGDQKAFGEWSRARLRRPA